VVSLLAFDFTIAYLPQEADMSTLVVIAMVYVFFTVEVILAALADPKYLLTFFCLLDIVGALSLIPDMLQLVEGMGLLDYGSSASDMSNAGKVGRVARAGSTVKLARFARLFRVVRLVRVIRLFRMSMTDGVHQADNTPSRPSNVGKLLATKVTQRIVALIIGMILVLPYLEVPPSVGAVSMRTVLQHVESIRPVGSIAFNESVAELVNEMKNTGQPFIYLRVSGVMVVELEPHELEMYRTSDIISHCIPNCDGFRMLSEYDSSAQNSIKTGNVVQAQLSMAMCFFVIAAFVLSSHAVSNDARELVIKPIERMTKIVHKLASTVCMLSNENEKQSHSGSGSGSGNVSGSGSGGENGIDENSLLATSTLETLNEAELLEEVMTQMTVALKAKETHGSSRRRSSSNMFRGRSSSFNRSSNMMNFDRRGSGSTNNDRKWKSRFSFSGSAHIYAAEGGPNNTVPYHKSSDLTSMSFSLLPVDLIDEVKQHRDLVSIETILHSRLASKYLRQHMARTLTLENYMFFDEVEKLKSMQTALRERIFKRFILESSPNQVNLDAGTRGRIEMYMLESTGITTPFDDAQKIVMNLMQLNTYIPFLTSDKCRQYVQEASLHRKIALGPYVHAVTDRTNFAASDHEDITHAATIVSIQQKQGR
jgi:hypothetical protein